MSEKKKREHIVPILSGRLTLRYQDFSDFDVQIPDKNYRSILFNCRWDLKDSPLWIVKPAGNRAEDFLRRRAGSTSDIIMPLRPEALESERPIAEHEGTARRPFFNRTFAR